MFRQRPVEKPESSDSSKSILQTQGFVRSTKRRARMLAKSGIQMRQSRCRRERALFPISSSSETVLNDISLEIKLGETVALAGESGAGKSTLAALLPRFYEPTKGQIIIDGQNLAAVTQERLRRQIGIVQQNVFLFDGTIRENIPFGNLGTSEKRLTEAVTQANHGRRKPAGLYSALSYA